MTYRDSAKADPAPYRPPQLFGFALYLVGAGAAVMALARVAYLDALHHWFSLPWPYEVARHGPLVGELMIAVGLALAWRTTRPPYRRLAALAATLFVSVVVLDMQQQRVKIALSGAHPTMTSVFGPVAATFAGWAIALSLLAVLVYAGGRAFASRTWATTLGAALLLADAWEQAWALSIPAWFRLPGPWTQSLLQVFEAVGMLVLAGGLFAAGRSTLRGVTIAEYLDAQAPRRRPDAADDDARRKDPWTPSLRRGLPLFADAVVATAGMAAALAGAVATSRSVGVLPRDLREISAAGGQLAAGALLALALRRMSAMGRGPAVTAMWGFGILAASVVAITFGRRERVAALQDVMPFVQLAPPLLFAGAIYRSSAALRAFAAGGEAMGALCTRLRTTAALLAGVTLFAFFAEQAQGDLQRFFQVAAALVAGYALYSAILIANAVRRIEIALAAPPAPS